MTGVTLPAALPEWVRGWNPVDVLLVVFLVSYALDGLRRGFIAGVIGLLGIVATVALALAFAPAASALIRGYVNLPEVIGNVAGFAAVLIVGQLVVGIVVRLILVALRPVRLLLGPLLLLDHLLGIGPGLVQGVAIAALVLAPVQLLASTGPIDQLIEGSRLAPPITRGVAALTPQAAQAAEQILGDVPVFRPRVVEPGETIQLPPQPSFQVDPDAEAQLLALLNAERTSRGLNALVADEALRDVAREHSAEMFRLGYFSHTSPVSGDPAERLARAGITLRASGENLAYAPTVQIAHDGLMASPGHRANILEPAFTRVGIGVQNAGLHGRMFTQEFGG